MPVSPFEPDTTGRAPERRQEPPHGAVPPEMRTSPAFAKATAGKREDRNDQRADETIEEPGYGHGV